MYKNTIWDWMNNNDSPTFLILMATLLALFPIIPYKVVIAALGYAYGTVWATTIAWLGTTLAAVLVYGIVRYAFREQGRRYLNKRRSIQSFTSTMESHPFMAIIVARLLPIVPQMVVNVFAGVASIPFWTFTLATILGKIPAILLYAYLGGNLVTKPYVSVALILGYLFLVTIILLVYRQRNKSKIS